MTMLMDEPEEWWDSADWDAADDVIKQIKELRWEDEVRRAEAADPDDAA